MTGVQGQWEELCTHPQNGGYHCVIFRNYVILGVVLWSLVDIDSWKQGMDWKEDWQGRQTQIFRAPCC